MNLVVIVNQCRGPWQMEEIN